MTYGQLFMTLNLNVKIVENGTCVWIYFDSVNHDTFRVEWWNKEIPDGALKTLKAQEPVKPKKVNRYIDFDGEGHPYSPETYDCGACGEELPWKANYCPKCGKEVKWK